MVLVLSCNLAADQFRFFLCRLGHVVETAIVNIAIALSWTKLSVNRRNTLHGGRGHVINGDEVEVAVQEAAEIRRYGVSQQQLQRGFATTT